jgi:hypothetical protein
MIDKTGIKLDCINCYSNGSTAIEFYIKVENSLVKDYTLALDGEIHANMDFDLNLDLDAMLIDEDPIVFRKNMFAIPLSPYEIPGLFK